MTKSRNITTPRRPWSDRDHALMRQHYPCMATVELAEVLQRPINQIYGAATRLGLCKSAEYLASPAACRLRRGDRVGEATRFKPGLIPANKGLRRPGFAPGRMAQTQFKPGQKTGAAAKNWRPIGTILPDSEGFLRIKVREAQKGEPYGFGNPKAWPMLNRHVWEQHKGPIPLGHAIVFKDRDRSNVDINNLECISRGDLMLRNSSQRWGKDVFQLIQLRGALNRKLRSLDEKQDVGS